MLFSAFALVAAEFSVGEQGPGRSKARPATSQATQYPWYLPEHFAQFGVSRAVYMISVPSGNPIGNQ